MENRLSLECFVNKDQEGMYLTLPFTMPPNTKAVTLTCRYERHHEQDTGVEKGSYVSRPEINIIDLGLIAPDGSQVGASGSDKATIQISDTHATPGYRSCPLVPGRWQILIGAYKVAPAGVTTTYELTFSPKVRRLFKGDLHTHTRASDGVLSVEEQAQRARRHGLDFAAITDHNQMISAESLPPTARTLADSRNRMDPLPGTCEFPGG